MKKRIWALGTIVVMAGIAGGLVSCRPKPKEPAGFLSLMPPDSFFYLSLRDWKTLKETTRAFDFIETARRLKLFERFQTAIEAEAFEAPLPAGAAKIGEKLKEIRRNVSLWELLSGEIVLAAFPTEAGIRPAVVALCRLPAGRGELYQKQFEELVGLLSAGAAAKLSRSDYLGETLSSMAVSYQDLSLAPTWARVGDVFMLSSRPEGCRELVARLKGKGGKESLPQSRDFQRAFAGLDPRARGVMYIKMNGVVDWIRRIVRVQRRRIDGQIKSAGLVGGIEAPPARQVRHYYRGLMKALKTIDLVAGNSGLAEVGYWEKVRVYLDKKDGSPALLDLLKDSGREWDVLKYVPASSAAVSVWRLDPAKVYRLIANYVAADPRRGKTAVRKWQEAQGELGVDFKADVLSWLGDEGAAGALSFSRSILDPGAFVYLWKVKDRAAATAALDKLSRVAKEQSGTSLSISEEEYDGHRMKVIYLPIPLLPVAPTVGLVGDYAVLASRKDCWERVVDTYREREKSIEQDADFLRMRRRLDGTGLEFSSRRLEDQIDALIGLVRNVSSLVGMTVALGEKEQSSAGPGQETVKNGLSLLADVPRLLEDLKAFKFYGRCCSFNGEYLEIQEFIEIARKEAK